MKVNYFLVCALGSSMVNALAGVQITQEAESIRDIVSDTPLVNQFVSETTTVNIYESIGISSAIKSIIFDKIHPFLARRAFSHRAKDMVGLYSENYSLLWLGKPNSEKVILAVLSLLDNAGNDGLTPSNYDNDLLRKKLSIALSLSENDSKQRAAYDTALSLSLLRFCHDLHYGRVNPRSVNYDLKLRDRLIDLPALIKNSLASNSINQLPVLLTPKLHQYQKLKEVLAGYRRLNEGASPLIFPVDNLDAVELRNFLVALGDMPNMESDISSGIKSFQQRHGLDDSKVLDKETLAAMKAPLSKRITQIELAMERLRWLPAFEDVPFVFVNIPAFKVWEIDNMDQPTSEAKSLNVIVGKSVGHKTPVLMADISSVDFHPYWNVPYSIVKNEMLSKLSDGYLARQNMEIIDESGNKVSNASLSKFKQGQVRIRQRPGGKNALGRVKFVFPNKYSVYLHDTQTKDLFTKTRRDFSHGCIRVSNPANLAEFLLKNQWSKASVQHAMDGSKSQQVQLNIPVSVILFYTTTAFDRGNVVFYPDIYGYDDVLLSALKNPVDVSDDSIFVSDDVKFNVDSVEL